jgi:glycosyltransferase involved in cell wall biosynthesis
MASPTQQPVGIVYFGNDWFAENRTSSHHIARLLNRRYPLLYVESPGLRAPTASGRDFRKLFRKLRMAFAPPRQIGDRMWHVTVPQIPFRRFRLVSGLNRLLARAIVHRGLRRLAAQRVVSWFVVPHPHAMARQLAEALVVYYCVDDYASFPGMDAAAVRHMDDDLTRKADLIFAVSEPLVESKRLVNAQTVYSPHGVDADLFARALDPATPVPDLVRDVPHPVIGFFGVFGAWIDLPLLRFLAESRPSWTFLFVGLVSTDVSLIKDLPNVRFAGAQPYASLPGWAKAFDVAIIPTLRNQQRMNANPLKLREYLATGKPVVTVSTPATAAFADFVSLADTPSEFLNAIEYELANDSPEKREQRRASVAGNTWEARVAEIDRVFRSALDGKTLAAEPAPTHVRSPDPQSRLRVPTRSNRRF